MALETAPLLAAARAAELNAAGATSYHLSTDQAYWVEDGIVTGADLDAYLAWVAWKQTYRFIRDVHAPASHWSQRTAAEWRQAERTLES